MKGEAYFVLLASFVMAAQGITDHQFGPRNSSSLRNEQCLSKNIWRPKKCEKNYYNCAKPKVAQKCADTCSYCEVDTICDASQKTKKVTDGTCTIGDCSKFRGPTYCLNGRCICADGYFIDDRSPDRTCTPCSSDIGRFCDRSQKQKAETDGTCRFGSCSASRGPTKCIAGKCICATGYFTNDKKTCKPCGTPACKGGNSCCSPNNKCGKDQGDCDTDKDCKFGLVCGSNNCKNKSGFEWDSNDDCCVKGCIDLSKKCRRLVKNRDACFRNGRVRHFCRKTCDSMIPEFCNFNA